MMTVIPSVLAAPEVARARALLAAAAWADGRATAGAQSALAKRNLQVPESDPQGRELGQAILQALGTNPLFVSAALPLRVFPPLFNRYEADAGHGFGAHVDNAIRFSGGQRFRTDLSATLFLSDPTDYDGGELVVADTYGEHAVKLAAGDLVLYPASSLHRVEPVTRGSRLAAFFWVQSMIRGDAERALLHEMDAAIQHVRSGLGDADAGVLKLTASYHNLLRLWAEV